MEPKKTISSWLTNRYLLIIRNEENFAEKSTFSFNYAKLIVFFFSLFSILLIISLYLASTILGRWFDPRFSEMVTTRKVIELSQAVDSLSEEVNKKEEFIKSIQNIMGGEGVNKKETVQTQVDSQQVIKDLFDSDLPPIDSQIRQEFESPEGGGDLVMSLKRGDDLQELFFFSPLSGGLVSSPYNSKLEHYGADIVAKENEPVKAVADGTVIFASWTQDGGNVIAIQHRNNLISIYKHNSFLLKKEGNFVSAGDLISIIGNTGEFTTGPHLHFELWYNGNPVDPTEYVSF